MPKYKLVIEPLNIVCSGRKGRYCNDGDDICEYNQPGFHYDICALFNEQLEATLVRCNQCRQLTEKNRIDTEISLTSLFEKVRLWK